MLVGSSDFERGLVAKVDSSGELELKKTYASADERTLFNSITQAGGGDYYIAGSTATSNWSRVRGLILEWSEWGLKKEDLYSRGTESLFSDVVSSGDGGYVGVGYTAPDDEMESHDFYIIKTSSQFPKHAVIEGTHGNHIQKHNTTT